MKYYTIKVNGKTYQVEVEEQSAPVAVVNAETAPVAAPTVNTSATPAPAEAAVEKPAENAAPVSAKEGATPVRAPMPGTILDVKVQEGQEIAANSVLCILEAMKMENEIIFPAAGKVVQVAVSNGKTVNAGDLLFSVQE